MKSGMPWGLSDIDELTRATAEEAARQAGMTLDEWLRGAVAERAAEEGIRPEAEIAARDVEDEDALVLADAVARLSDRIRRMSPAVRPYAGVHQRLAEIEAELDRARERGGERQTLPGITRMVERLARDLDDADETARSTVEGIRAGRQRKGDDLAATLRGLEAQVAALAGEERAAAHVRRGHDDLRARLDALLARAGEPARGQAPRIGREQDVRLRQIGAKLAEIGRRLGEPSPRRQAPPSARPPAPEQDELTAAIAEIAERQSRLNGRSPAPRHAEAGLAGTLDALRAEVAGLSDRVATLARAEEADRRLHAALEQRIDTLSAELSLDREHLAAIRGQLDNLRAASNAAAREATLLDRFDDLLRKLPDRARLEALEAELAALRDRLDGEGREESIARLELRLGQLARSVEGAIGARAAAEEATSASIAATLADLRGVVDALAGGHDGQAVAVLRDEVASLRSAVESLEMAGRADSAALGRIEARLDEIATSAPAEPVGALAEKIEALARRVERLPEGPEPPTEFGRIRAEIEAIRSGMEGRDSPRVDDLEAQIRDIAERLDTVTRPGSDPGQLAALEARVESLAEALDNTVPRMAALREVEEKLMRLQASLAEGREESIAAARAAARAAVHDLAAAGFDRSVIDALRRELDPVGEAASTAEATRPEAMPAESRHDAPPTIVDRPAAEDEDRPPRFAFMEPAAASRAAPDAAPLPLTRAPAASPEAAYTARNGTDAPGAERRPADRRADFIAAARRAARAAVAEANAGAGTGIDLLSPPPDTGAAPGAKPSPFARIGDAIRSRRRPLLLAVAAIVIAFGAFHLFGARLAGEHAEHAHARPAAAATEPPSGQPAPAAERGAAPAVPSVEGAALVAPPTDARTAMSLAREMSVGSRFGDAFAAPDAAGSFVAGDGGQAAQAQLVAVSEVPDVGPERLRLAAAAGDAAAAAEIATRLAEGRGITRNLPLAAAWYHRAAEAGIAVAQYRLGSLYERGQGVAEDRAKAVRLYQRAADQGNVGAMHNLAVLISEGAGGPPDQGKAIDWFTAAADYGVKDSQYNLGVIYARGLGVEPDLVQSYKWFAIAAAAGDRDAAARRDEVAASLGPDELARARAAVSAWRAKVPLVEANVLPGPDGGWGDESDGVTAADRRALVKTIQTLLAEQGYDPGPADGVDGPKTREAVRAFQASVGLASTGIIDPALVAALSGRSG
jgi:localization factor PodJL